MPLRGPPSGATNFRLETPHNRFRVKVFLPVVDECIMQLQTRFESLQNVLGLFSFLFPEQLMTLHDCDLQDQVTKLAKKNGNDVSSDLYRQLLAFRACTSSFNQKAKDSQDISNVIMNLEISVCFPDVVTAYTIFFTLPWAWQAMNGASQSSSCWRHIWEQLCLTIACLTKEF